MMGGTVNTSPTQIQRLPGETLAAFTFIGGRVKLVASVVEQRNNPFLSF
jgi:hypothetical protein